MQRFGIATRVVYDRVDPAVSLQRQLDQLLQIRFAGHRPLQTGTAEFGGKLFGGGRARHEDHAIATIGETARAAGADPLTGCRDDGNAGF